MTKAEKVIRRSYATGWAAALKWVIAKNPPTGDVAKLLAVVEEHLAGGPEPKGTIELPSDRGKL